MTISAPRAVASSTSVRTRFFQWLRPLDLGGQQGIKSLDGLRAVAALMVVSYHIIGVITWSPALGGFNIHFIWQYLASGVLLFFVLSGFLLYLPYVRAMLDGRPLPAERRFYENRALRILPAFYVCLFILAAVHWQEYSPSQNFADIAVHVFFIHDISAQTVFAFDGPFWTLAAEWQFYLLLPLIAWGISRLVAKAAIPAALIGLGVCGFIGLALVYRAVAGLVVEHMGRIPAGLYWWVDRFLRITIGYQGKFLEVFGIRYRHALRSDLRRGSRERALARAPSPLDRSRTSNERFDIRLCHCATPGEWYRYCRVCVHGSSRQPMGDDCRLGTFRPQLRRVGSGRAVIRSVPAQAV